MAILSCEKGQECLAQKPSDPYNFFSSCPCSTRSVWNSQGTVKIPVGISVFSPGQLCYPGYIMEQYRAAVAAQEK